MLRPLLTIRTELRRLAGETPLAGSCCWWRRGGRGGGACRRGSNGSWCSAVVTVLGACGSLSLSAPARGLRADRPPARAAAKRLRLAEGIAGSSQATGPDRWHWPKPRPRYEARRARYVTVAPAARGTLRRKSSAPGPLHHAAMHWRIPHWPLSRCASFRRRAPLPRPACAGSFTSVCNPADCLSSCSPAATRPFTAVAEAPAFCASSASARSAAASRRHPSIGIAAQIRNQVRISSGASSDPRLPSMKEPAATAASSQVRLHRRASLCAGSLYQGFEDCLAAVAALRRALSPSAAASDRAWHLRPVLLRLPPL